MVEPTHVEGRTPVRLMLYTLSTCGWCRKTKTLLNELGVGYDYIDVDLLTGEERDQMKANMAKWNPRCSAPTIVINDSECIVGYQEEKLRSLAAQ